MTKNSIFLLISFFISSKGLATSDLERSIKQFSAFNDQKTALCHQYPQSATCPEILKKLVSQDKQSAFFGALKARYDVCSKFTPNQKISASRLQSLMQYEHEDLGSYSNNTIKSCTEDSNVTTDHVGKFYYYNRQLNTGASTLIRNQIVIANLLKKESPPCPSIFTLKKASAECESQKKCSSKNSLDVLSKQVDTDLKLYQQVTAEYKTQLKECRRENCQPYLENLKAILLQLNLKNPWFLNDAFMSSSNNPKTQDRLKDYFEKMYSSQAALLKATSNTASCIHGTSECTIKDMRETLEKMPIQGEIYGKSKIKNYLSQVMESQQCIEEGALDRDRTSKTLGFAARDAALSVVTLGVSSIPMLVKLGLTGRSLATARIGGEVLDISVNAYFAGMEWNNTIQSCNDKEISSLDRQDGGTCNTEIGLLFNQNTSNCMLNGTIAALATLPLGLNFLQRTKLLHFQDLAAQNSKVTPEILQNASLPNSERAARFEKLMGAAPGTYTGDSRKIAAIVKAHNMPGTLGNLTFSQIRQRVSFLKKKGFSSKEIRTGLDNGLFGHLPTSGRDIAKESKAVDVAVEGFINNELKNGRIVQKIDDTTWKSGQDIFTGENNGGIEIIEQNGKKLFAKIKFPPKNTENLSANQVKLLEDLFLNEVSYTKRLSDLGLGPKFHGVVKGSDGKYRIVTDFVDGYEVHLGEVNEVAGKIPMATIQEINKKSNALLDAGIDPIDIQFRVSNDGKAYVIDPEYFSALTSQEKAVSTQILRESLDDLRFQKSKSLLSPKSYSSGKSAPDHLVTFNAKDDLKLAKDHGLVTTGAKLPQPTKGKAAAYNYVLLDDGQMVLGKVENEWQVGVSHMQLAAGKNIVGMGELAILDSGRVSYNVSSVTHSSTGSTDAKPVDVKAIQQKVSRLLGSDGNSSPTIVEYSSILTPTRKPFYGEMMKYCSDNAFRARNASLCSQLSKFAN